MSKLLSFFALAVGAAIFSIPTASAATLTVCSGGGCDYTTISAAEATASPGDVISVGGIYSAADETFPLVIDVANLSIVCSGATIGQTNATGNNTFQLTTSSTISGCGLSNVKLYTQASEYVSGINISGNTAVGTATTTIYFAGQIGYASITDNRNLDSIVFNSTSTNVTISGNTFYGDVFNNSSGILLGMGAATATAVTVTNNIFESRLTSISGASNLKLIDIFSPSVTFTTNTVRYIEQAPSAIVSSIWIQTTGASPTVVVRGNKIEGPNRADSDPAVALSIFPGSNMNQSVTATIANNTFRNRMASGAPLMIQDAGHSASISFAATIRNNLFFASVSSIKTAMEFSRGAGNTLTATIVDNAVYGGFTGYVQNSGSADVGSGSGYITFDPHMQLADVDTGNDNDVAPYSLLLDIDGAGTKIGATTTTRRTTINVFENGLVDYVNTDATSIGSVTSSLRSGDTLALNYGEYDGFEINSAYATTSLTITGYGEDTIINAGTNANGITLTSVTSSVMSGFVVRNASSTSDGYISTLMNFRFSDVDYDDAIAPIGLSANQGAFILNGDFGIVTVTADGDSVTSATGMGTHAFHLGLIDFGGTKSTLLIPDSLFANQAAAETAWGGFGVVFDKFVEDVFTVSGGVYTYQSATVAAELVTVKSGLSTPAITQSNGYYAGIKFVSSGGATITNVTSTANGYGIWFASGGGSRIYDSVLSSSTGYDIRQGASVTNTIDNVTFTRTSSTVDTLAAPLLVKFQARALLRRAANTDTVISGVAVTSTDSLLTATSLGSTGGDGYTSYTRLPAYTITNASAALTNGGYNPYTIASGSVSGYAASSTSATLSSRDQTVTIDLVSNVAATAPSSAAAASIAATSAAFGWTDNSDDETSFTINYVTSSLGQVLGVDSGSTSTTSAGVTSATFTLSPNLQYRFRVAAVGPGGTSTYATSSLFYTLAATPGAPALTATGRTTATVVMDANGNSTSTEFLLYNSTLSSYVTSTGASVSSPYWTGTSTWATITIADLTCNTAYSFVAVARNGDATETSTSTAGTVTTSACATSSSGGGGGGGGVGASGATFIPTPIATPTPVTTSPTVPLSPIIVADTPTDPGPLPPAAPATVRTLQTDARSFGVTLAAPDQERLASFVDNGTSAETRALGSGERRALVRDALETMGRSNVPLSDLERMARGEIPATRNLVIEREQLPRVRSTFRSLYNRDPNFRNADENLVWNTMMYRIRFPRNLAAEREGIQDFRQAFNRTPTDPFQWAVVRALGYVL